jgi:hypothetical protein
MATINDLDPSTSTQERNSCSNPALLSPPKYQNSWYTNAILLVGEKVFFQVNIIFSQVVLAQK